MASNKKYRIGYIPTAAETISVKIGRNAPCPCGSKIEKIFVDEDGNETTIPVPVKYKHCCMGKQFFFKSQADMERAKNLDSKLNNKI